MYRAPNWQQRYRAGCAHCALRQALSTRTPTPTNKPRARSGIGAFSQSLAALPDPDRRSTKKAAPADAGAAFQESNCLFATAYLQLLTCNCLLATAYLQLLISFNCLFATACLQLLICNCLLATAYLQLLKRLSCQRIVRLRSNRARRWWSFGLAGSPG